MGHKSDNSFGIWVFLLLDALYSQFVLLNGVVFCLPMSTSFVHMRMRCNFVTMVGIGLTKNECYLICTACIASVWQWKSVNIWRSYEDWLLTFSWPSVVYSFIIFYTMDTPRAQVQLPAETCWCTRRACTLCTSRSTQLQKIPAARHSIFPVRHYCLLLLLSKNNDVQRFLLLLCVTVCFFLIRLIYHFIVNSQTAVSDGRLIV